MEFNEMKILYDIYAKSGDKDYADFYYTVLKDASQLQRRTSYSFENHSAPIYNAIADYIWIQNNKPYYKVHPQIVETFLKAKMSDIPCNLLLPKNEIESIVVCLAKEDHHIKNKFGVPLKSFMVLRSKQNGRIIFHNKKHTLNLTHNAFILLCDWSETTDVGSQRYPVYSISAFLWDTGQEILEEQLDRMHKKNEDSDVSSDTLNSVFRLAISVCFLIQNENPLIEPDILTKDLGDYYRSPTLKKQLIEKAFKKRRKKGYKIGCSRKHEFIILNPPIQGGHTGQGDRELTNSHFRNGHWHLVRFGKKKSESKVMWYFPTVVRPDLSFKG